MCFCAVRVADVAMQPKRRASEAPKEKVSICGYTDDSNPYGDSKLTEKFVWGKKVEWKYPCTSVSLTIRVEGGALIGSPG